MSYWVKLTQEERNRMIYATIDCTDSKCMAKRGERCVSLINSSRSNDPGFTMTPHCWRQRDFTQWKKANPDKYRKLEDQILMERYDEAESYETCPA